MSTLLERRREKLGRAKAGVLWPEHYDDGTFIWAGFGGEITAYRCGCGQNFAGKDGLDEHLANEKGESNVFGRGEA